MVINDDQNWKIELYKINIEKNIIVIFTKMLFSRSLVLTQYFSNLLYFWIVVFQAKQGLILDHQYVYWLETEPETR